MACAIFSFSFELNLLSTASFPITKSCDALSPAKGEVSSKEVAALGVEDEVAEATDDEGDFLERSVSCIAFPLGEIDESTSVAVVSDAGGVGGLELRSAAADIVTELANFLQR